MFNYKSYGDLSRDIAGNLHRIPEIDCVVGIPKSGLIPGIMIASLKNAKFYDLDTFLFIFSNRSGMRIYSETRQRVLLVEDSVDAGAEFAHLRKRVEHLEGDFDFVTCAVYGSDPSKGSEAADLTLTFVPQPRIFQWNYRDHIIAEHALFDMDGVLYVDRTEDQSNDGRDSSDLVLTDSPLAIPTNTIAAIITSRLERYRSETEEWLGQNGIEYKELIMMDSADDEEGGRLKAHASFKAAVYKSRSEYLFIESKWEQAQIIAREADKAVLCTQNDVLITGRDHLEALEKSGWLLKPESMGLELDLQMKIERLVDRLSDIDPFASAWLDRAGIAHDPKKIRELTPFQKTRLVISSLGQRDPARDSVPAKSTDAKRILIISTTFDTAKGAGAAASSARLRESLAGAGYDLFSLSLEDFPELTGTSPDRPISGTKMDMWIEYANGQHSERLAKRIDEIDPDCIVLGAVDRGIITMFDVAEIRRPIVWLAEDNWLHTGGCLFKIRPSEVVVQPLAYADYMPALTCEGYKQDCSQCPALGAVEESSKTRMLFEIKRAVFGYRQDIVFAPISDWMAGMLREAPLTASHSIVASSNPIDRKIMRRLPRRPRAMRSALGIGRDEKVVLLAAHSLSNPREGTKLALEAFATDERLRNVAIVITGEPFDRKLIPHGMKVHSLGSVGTDEDEVAIYNMVDATLVPALQEGVSDVASDSIRCGTPVVSFATSGLASFLVHEETGYLAKPFDGADLVRGLDWVLNHADADALSRRCLEVSEEQFSPIQSLATFEDAIQQAVRNFAGLGPMPIELEMLRNAMILMNVEHSFRDAAFRQSVLRANELETTALAPSKVYDELFDLREKLGSSGERLAAAKAKASHLERTRQEIEVKLTAANEGMKRVSQEARSLRAELDASKLRYAEAENEMLKSRAAKFVTEKRLEAADIEVSSLRENAARSASNFAMHEEQVVRLMHALEEKEDLINALSVALKSTNSDDC